jgi:hypothetical protein
VHRAFYTLADETRETILVACRKCEWRAAFLRKDLIAEHGTNYAMPNLLDRSAAPNRDNVCRPAFDLAVPSGPDDDCYIGGCCLVWG